MVVLISEVASLSTSTFFPMIVVISIEWHGRVETLETVIFTHFLDYDTAGSLSIIDIPRSTLWWGPFFTCVLSDRYSKRYQIIFVKKHISANVVRRLGFKTDF